MREQPIAVVLELEDVARVVEGALPRLGEHELDLRRIDLRPLGAGLAQRRAYGLEALGPGGDFLDGAARQDGRVGRVPLLARPRIAVLDEQPLLAPLGAFLLFGAHERPLAPQLVAVELK